MRIVTWNDIFFTAITRGDDPFRAMDIADEWMMKKPSTYQVQALSDKPWIASAPHPQTKAVTIVNAQGRVIAALVPNVTDATFICELRNSNPWTALGEDTLALLEDFKADGKLHATVNIWDDMIARWRDALGNK